MRQIILTCVAIVPAAAASTVALADDDQSSSRAQPALEAVVVTAQKREERLQDAPLSVGVLSGEDLEGGGITGLTDALSRVPGVATQTGTISGGTVISIRGVSAAGALFNGSSPIGYYLDSVPFGLVKSAIEPDPQAYDLQRVEVLRGPQGVLYGASAENGLVRVLTHPADLSSFDFKARGIFSGTDNGRRNYSGDAAINIPLIENKLAIRAVVGYENVGGWIDSAVGKNVNYASLRNYRIHLNATPTDDLSVEVTSWSSRNDYAAPSSGLSNYNNNAITDQPIQTNFDAEGLQVGYRLPWATLTSQTSYLRYTNDSYVDLTPLLPPSLRTALTTQLQSHVFSQEVNLVSADIKPWRWSAGLFYRDDLDHQYQNIPLLDPNPLYYTSGSKSWALYGEVGRRFFEDQWELAVGGRYFHDDVTVTGNDYFVSTVKSYDRSDTFNAATPRVTLSWYPSTDLSAYASYAQGFRSGFAQDVQVAIVDPQYPPVKPDRLHNYELGFKGTLFQKVSYEAAVFYMDWRDVQFPTNVLINSVPSSVILNATSASGPGFEIGVTTQPLAGLSLGIDYTWNQLETDAPLYTATTDGPSLLIGKNARLPYSPKYVAGTFVSYEAQLGSTGWIARWSASGNYTSAMSIYPLQTGDPVVDVRSRLEFAAPKHWTVSAFVNNLTNANPGVIPNAVPIWTSRVQPRTAGLQVEYHMR